MECCPNVRMIYSKIISYTKEYFSAEPYPYSIWEEICLKAYIEGKIEYLSMQLYVKKKINK